MKEKAHGMAGTPIEEMLREEIAASGPLSFERFMDVSLYHPQYGYYCRGQKPIGIKGDFYTASQLQPVFGALIRGYMERLSAEHQLHLPPIITEYGAGRGEMAEAFTDWEYRGVEVHSAAPSTLFRGAIFGNELFDAFPVEAAVCKGGQFFERRVTWRNSRFEWTTASEPSSAIAGYASRFGAPSLDGFEFEVHQRSVHFLENLLANARNALCVFVDYGYFERDWKRFPEGTLMSYREHRADADVLADPGERDITSHVPFHVLAEVANQAGGEVLRMERLANAFLYAGEKDEFQFALSASNEREEFARRQQLKTLLFGLGESFLVIAIAKGGHR